MVVDVMMKYLLRTPRRRCEISTFMKMAVVELTVDGRRDTSMYRRRGMSETVAAQDPCRRRTLLPSWRSAKAIASCDPIASPSGLAWDVMTKRCRWRMASRISGIFSVLIRLAALLLCDLLEKLFDPVLMADGFVEPELQLGRATQSQPLADLPHEPVARSARAPCFLRRRIAQLV